MNQILFDERARQRLLQGVDVIDRAVGCTLGPGGKTVIIEDRFGNPHVTKDGAYVARQVHVKDQFAQMGVAMLAEAALQVAERAGDGTTTTVVMAADLLRCSLQFVAAGIDPATLCQEITEGAAKARDCIWSHSQDISDSPGMLALVGNVSGNGDLDIVRAATEAITFVGKGGVVLLQSGDTDKIEVQCANGFVIPNGWNQELAPDDSRAQLMTGGAHVCVAHRHVVHAQDVLPILTHAEQCETGVLFIVEQMSGDALQTVLQNRKIVNAMVVKAPGFDDRLWNFMHDAAIWSDGKVQDISTGPLDPQYVGYVETVEQTRTTTTLTGPMRLHGDGDVDARIKWLETTRDTTSDEYDRDKAVERLGRLKGRVASIRVGAPTPSAQRELKDRTEDALNAMRVAQRSGIQPGGGYALARASQAVGVSNPGSRVLGMAMRAPMKRILENAGTDPTGALIRLRDGEWHHGNDAFNRACDMTSFPDPTEVVLEALSAAVSIVTTMLKTQCAMISTDPV